MFKVSSRGDDKKTRDFIDRVLKRELYSDLERYGKLGVEALSRYTPQDTGRTAISWNYRVERGRRPGIIWYNDHVTEDGTPVAVLIQYGHGTGTGGYVQGIDFINPAMRPLFQQIADDIWKKVTA